MSIYSWSTTAATNASADGTADLADNQPGVDTRNSVRAVMARIAAWIDQLGGAATYGGTGNAYTMTSPSGHALTAYAAGQLIMLVPNATNSGAATLNADSLGAKSILTADGGALVAGDLVSGGRYLLAYDGSAFQVLNTLAGGAFQPLDATLTAFAGLSFTATDAFLRATGADTFTVEAASAHRSALGLAIGTHVQAYSANLAALDVASTSFGRGLLNLADAAAGRTSLGVVIGTDVLAYSANVAALNVASTSFGRGLLNLADAAAGRTAFALGTISTQAASAVAITGGTLAGVTVSGTADGVRVAVSAETTGTLTAASANRIVRLSGDATLNNSVFTAGDVIVFYAGASARTLTPGSGVTMRLAGSATTGARTIAARGLAVAYFDTASEVIISGQGVS